MLFYVILFLVIIFALAAKLFYDSDYDGLYAASMTGVIATCVTFIVMAVSIAWSHVSVVGYMAKMDSRYDTLIYQYENDIYDNDNDLGKRELMSDIQNWNEDLAYRKQMQDDFWLGIFYPNIYDHFEFIKLD